MRPVLLVLILLSQLLAPHAVSAGSAFVPKAMEKDALQRDAAARSDIEQQIRSLDLAIVLELIKLAEFNVKYQQTVNHYAGWRKVVYPLGQEAGYATFLGYSVNDMSQRARAWNNPGLISPTLAKRGLTSAMVGSLLGSTSSGVELIADAAETLRAKRSGFSVPDSVSFVQDEVKQVDSMLSRRDRLFAVCRFTGKRRELLELKEQLLKYERDRLVFEFDRWSTHSRGYAWYKNAFYVINATVNLARFSAVLAGFGSFRSKQYAGATGPLLITASVLAALGPVASSTVGNCISRYHQRYLRAKLNARPFLSDEQAKRQFERLAQLLESNTTQDENSQLAAELVNLRQERLGLDKLITHEESTIQRLRRVAGQQSRTAPLISTMGAASGTLSTIGYYGYRGEPVINNRLGVAGDSAIVAAEAIALIATPTAAISAFSYEHRLRRKGEHPEQLLSNRLQDLQKLETILKASSW